MSNCLLCGQAMKNKTRFSDLIFFSKEKSGICEECFSTFEEIAEQHCPHCYKNGESESCKDCQYWQNQGKPVVHTALYQYNQAMAHYFSRYKFQGDYVLRNIFAKKLRIALSQFPDYTIVPIPISQKRLSERGFNQVEGLLSSTNIPYQSLLGKYESQKQSSKNRAERLETKQMFYLLDEKEVPEKILLFDDIYTTGATIQLAVELFMKIGRKEIKTFSLTR
ncbi:ComF family protein [Streptococcus suis]|uniref:ComF family protein n=1 Tax=Streptococcus suis TaxID=1307 RepID=UPI0005CED783|nr:ComF family protein [Streptococcus suis]MCK3848317.1 ComF family protein [Streptococcus suis]MCK3948664.1 ComF family protein [Streptococcus suis]MCK3962128.1 ComF family protein [Streptococcus suis]MCK3990705.1 ComF family protein [Streptococcus suis]MCK4065756.1 ComF family protein [Streptococcus suis]